MKGYFTGKPLPKDHFERCYYIADNQHGSGSTKVWKDRFHNLSEVESLRNEALQIREKLSKQWDKLFDTCQLLKHVQGTVEGNHYYLDASDRGISFRIVSEHSKDEEMIRLMPDEDLPMYIGREDELEKNAVNLLKDRLKGPKASGNLRAVECPVRNDLISKYIYLNGRFGSVRRVISVCSTIIKEYISTKYHDFYQKYTYEEAIIDLVLNDRHYTFEFTPRQGFEFIRLPESPYYTDDGVFNPKPELKSCY